MVSTLFEGQLLSSVKCCTCRQVSHTHNTNPSPSPNPNPTPNYSSPNPSPTPNQVSHTRDGCFELSLPLPAAAHKGGDSGKTHRQHSALANGAGGAAGGGDSPPPPKAPRQGLGGTFNRSLSLSNLTLTLTLT